MYRRAQRSDLPRLIQLFTEVFGDPQPFAQMVMERFSGVENVFAAERDGEVIACLCAVPVTLKGLPGAYFYGVCCDEKHRGQGIATGLMKAAQDELAKQGVRFVTLIPASERLFGFYEKLGYRKAFAKRKVQCTVRNNLWAVADFDTITAKGLETLRRQYAPASVMLKSDGYKEVLMNLYSGGLTTVSTEKGYGLYFKRGDRLEFVELFAQTDRDAEYILEAARQKTGTENASILLAESQNLFLGEGDLQDYGMICFLGESFVVQDCYMRLMMDD